MSDVSDMRAAMGEIKAAADLVETCDLAPARDSLDIGTGNAVIDDDVPAGFAVFGQGSLLIQGDLHGVEDRPCLIEVDGDVVVTGTAWHAWIFADNIYLGGAVRDCRLTAAGHIRVGGDAQAVRLTAGACQDQLHRIQKLQGRLAPALNELFILERRLPLEEARMHRQCQATSIPLDFSMGQFIQHADSAVRIDLSTFFASIGENQGKQLDLALAEFFAKGIIGVVARTNRKYLVNQAREIVFMRLLKSLRELYMMTAQKERLTAQVERYRTELGYLQAQLEEGERTICIGGDCDASCELEFHRPEIKGAEDGYLSYSERIIGLFLRPGPNISYWELCVQGATGGDVVHQVPDSRGLVLRLQEGEVAWSQADVGAVHG